MRNTNLNGQMGVAAVLFFLLITAGCSMWGSSSSAPPNPVAQTSQPPSAPLPSTPSMSGPTPVYHNFPDIPVPQELNVVAKSSYVFQSGPFKAGLLTLKGRVDTGSLVNFFQMAMPRENWKPRGGFHYRRSVLIFEKPDKSCVINIFEKTYYTYVEIYVAPAGGPGTP